MCIAAPTMVRKEAFDVLNVTTASWASISRQQTRQCSRVDAHVVEFKLHFIFGIYDFNACVFSASGMRL
jgi:hypothetical protein